MARLVLVGAKEGKRRDYYARACAEFGQALAVYSYEEYLHSAQAGDLVKLDPPPINGVRLDDLRRFADAYHEHLSALAALRQVRFLNPPQDLWTFLDKKACKARLMAEGVPVTPPLVGAPRTLAELLDLMQETKQSRVFIKPRYGSGAAGVAALSRRGRQLVLYTSLLNDGDTLFNTRKVRRFTESARINALLTPLLQEDCLLERWIPKAEVDGVTYDLRIVWLLGETACIIPRGASSPITNLHLNDNALDLAQLHLDPALLAQIQTLARKAMAVFPHTACAGLDILLPAQSQACPLIIEINGQGDLIYKDIFAENTIYRRQVRYLLEQET